VIPYRSLAAVPDPALRNAVAVEGPTERELLRTGQRYALAVRVIVSAVSSVASLLLDAPREPVSTVAVVALFNAWNGLYMYRFIHVRGRLLIPADVLIVASIGLSQVWTTPAGVSPRGTTWVLAVTAIVVITYPWLIPPRQQLVATLLLVSAHLAGTALAEPIRWLTSAPVQLWMVAEALLSTGLFVLVRRAARDTDRLTARSEQARASAVVAKARRADEREYLAALHDTAAATLLMVGSGVLPGRSEQLAAQAARDLEVLDGQLGTVMGEVDLVESLRQVVVRSPLRLTVTAPAELAVPAPVATALGHATQEALTNVVRHAGVDSAELRVCGDDRSVVVEIADDGVGFDPASPRTHTHGVDGSLIERMIRAGGQAVVTSRPGAGTTVRLSWATQSAHGSPTISAGAISANLTWTLRLAAAGAGQIVLYGLNLPKLVANWHAYSSAWVQVVAFILFTLVLLLVAAFARRWQPMGRWRWSLPVAVLLATMAATGDVPPESRLGIAHWTAADATWTVVLMAMECRLVTFVLLIAVQHLVMFGQVALGGDAEPGIAGVVNATLMVVSYQLAVGLLSAVLRRTAGAAAEVTHSDEQLRTAEAVSAQLHRDRTERYADLRRTAAPLLAGLAAGELDPADDVVRRACAVEAARMRRLFAEESTSRDPLLQDLQQAAEVAERRGVAVSLAERGEHPAVPDEVRRALTEPVLAALATAVRSARLTLVGSDRSVTLSVVADSPNSPDPIADRYGVATSVTTDAGYVRIKTSWRGGTWSPPL
jgi:signal transduction histidine kinase